MLAAFIALTTLNLSAQKISINFGPEIGIALGSFGDTHGVGIGATIQPEVKVASQVSVTAISGFKSYFGKDISSTFKYKTQTIIPIQVGLKYFFSKTPSNSFYGGADFGVGIFTKPYNFNAFAYSFGLGKKFNAKKHDMDVVLRYDGYSKNGSLSALNLRVGFGL